VAGAAIAAAAAPRRKVRNVAAPAVCVEHAVGGRVVGCLAVWGWAGFEQTSVLGT
jgi:hypothetical protein